MPHSVTSNRLIERIGLLKTIKLRDKLAVDGCFLVGFVPEDRQIIFAHGFFKKQKLAVYNCEGRVVIRKGQADRKQNLEDFYDDKIIERVIVNYSVKRMVSVITETV